MSTRRRRRWRLAGAAAMVLLGFLLWLELFGLHRRDLQTELAEWRAAGGQTSLRGMQPPGVDPDLNSAPMFQHALLRVPALSGAQRLALESPWRADELPPIVEMARASLQLAHAAAQRPLCAWPLVYEDGPAMRRHHLSPAPLMTRLLIAEALVRAEGSDLAGACASLEVAVRLGEDMLADPSVLSIALQRETEGWLIEAYEHIFRHQPAPPSWLEDAWARRDYRAQAERLFLAEGATWLTRLQPETPFDWSDPLSYPYSSSSLRGDTVQYLRSLRSFAAYYRRPYFDRRPVELHEPPEWAYLLQQLGRNPQPLNAELAAGEARLALARTAIALRRHKNQRGAYPAELAVLADAPLDPWSGAPLDYQRAGEGFVLRSAALNDQAQMIQWNWER